MPIHFKVLPYQEVVDLVSIQDLYNNWAKEYLRDRPNILIDVDIFCQNYRSNEQTYKNFNLFEKSDTPDVYVFPIYLELFEFEGKPGYIFKCIDIYSKKYPNNKIVFHWNHDNDWARYGGQIEQYNNVYITNFGYTSKKYKNDILLPFWVINTKPYSEPKRIFASFIGNPNNQLRQSFVQALYRAKNPNFLYTQAYGEEYKKVISSSIFNLCPRGGGGDGGFSYRFFETFHLNSIPVLFSDKTIFPYDDIDPDDICVKIPECYINDINEIYNILACKDCQKMINNINKIKQRFSLLGVQEEVYKRLS